ncbi:F-box/FBD/LRR-repeat protein At1g13570-like [Magnolia sinica]|uniref:F-box/FBD/LRR-repeat protein At1g13570-like n=1 Tax=Magnolia sinica TaxID=86752 RepID=UPI00265B7108|nr:F-box/FBD/LRR-repeat protein At1g13570-like [Magnolia sinica]
MWKLNFDDIYKGNPRPTGIQGIVNDAKWCLLRLCWFYWNFILQEAAEEKGDKISLQNGRPDLDFDLINDLPVDICNAILLRLSITDAVRTSILSRKWRYRWASIPHLVFDKDWILPKHHEVVDIINRVLSVHEGPAHKFVCSDHFLPLGQCGHHMDQWILFLSQHGIKQLTLGPFKRGYGYIIRYWYLMHSSLFSCLELTDLELASCAINPPPAFEGFRHLRNLKLFDIVIGDDELEQLISKCPLLETLTLDCIVGAFRFKINAPNLRYLCFTIEVQSSAYEDEYFHEGGICNLIKVFGSLRHIEKLILQYEALQFFSMGDIPDVLPASFLHLKNLSMAVSYMDSKEVFATLYILRSSPNLEKLEILIKKRRREPYNTPLAVFWEAQEHLGCLLNHLQTVKMTRIRGKECELRFIKFVLMNAPVLETMSIDIKKEITMVKN